LVYGFLMRHPSSLKSEALRLRTVEHKSLTEILKIIPVAKSTLSLWLRDHPLPPDEVVSRRKASRGAYVKSTARVWENLTPSEGSNLHRLAQLNNLTSIQKGALAETAILLRLVVRGYQVFDSAFDGSRADWVVSKDQGPLLKLQVKMAATPTTGYGAPYVKLTRAHNTRQVKRYQREDCDFIVGYHLYTDTAYVWSLEETSHLKRNISLTKESEEAWEKLNL